MRKPWLLLLVVLALSLAASAVALADDGPFGDEGYNWEDPVFQIAGTRVDVLITSDVPEGETVSRLTRVFLFVPRNVEASIVDDGGLDVRLVRAGRHWGGPVPLHIIVFKPRTDEGSRYPVSVNVKAGTAEFPAQGVSGIPIHVWAWVPPAP
ncbi:MAG: hypothetical protein ACP5UM_03610 [Anaerolineae bacterium]